MEYKTSYSERFLDHFGQMTEYEQKLIDRKIEILKSNIDHRSLRTQVLRGKQKNRYESSVSMDIRLIWDLYDDHIFFVDVGHHDILKIYG